LFSADVYTESGMSPKYHVAKWAAIFSLVVGLAWWVVEFVIRLIR